MRVLVEWLVNRSFYHSDVISVQTFRKFSPRYRCKFIAALKRFYPPANVVKMSCNNDDCSGRTFRVEN